MPPPPPPPPTALAAATAGDETDASLTPSTTSSAPPSPSSAFDAWATLRGRYRIPPEEVRQLLAEDSGPFSPSRGGADALLLALLPAAAALARPPISRYHVGATGLASSGAIYIGANMELPRCPLNQSVHAEQFLVANLAAHGETRLLTLAISAAPCGHCRQFYCELHRADAVRFVFGSSSSSGGDGGAGGAAGEGSGGAAAAAALPAAPLPPAPPRCYSLDELLPARFGPLDLLVPHDPVIEAAERAAARQEGHHHHAHARRRSSSTGGAHTHHHHHHHRPRRPSSSDAAAVAAAEGVPHPPTAKFFPPLMLEAQDNRVQVAPWVLGGRIGGEGLPPPPSASRFLGRDEAAALAARAAADPVLREAIALAACAARHGSYAPYTKAPSGVSFIVVGGTTGEGVGAGVGEQQQSQPATAIGGHVGYLEVAAYNPGLPPLQAALCASIARGELRGGLQDKALREVVVAELGEDGEGGGEAGGGVADDEQGATAGLVKHGFVTESVVRASVGPGVKVWRVPLVRI
jgi:cytidine deaminase